MPCIIASLPEIQIVGLTCKLSISWVRKLLVHERFHISIGVTSIQVWLLFPYRALPECVNCLYWFMTLVVMIYESLVTFANVLLWQNLQEPVTFPLASLFMHSLNCSAPISPRTALGSEETRQVYNGPQDILYNVN